MLHTFLCHYLQQKIDQWRLLAGRGETEVVDDQDSHEVKDELLSRVIGQIGLGSHIAVLGLAPVHPCVCSESFKLFCGRPNLIIQICYLAKEIRQVDIRVYVAPSQYMC